MRSSLLDDLEERCAGLASEGLFKSERVIDSTQSAHIRLADGTSVLNLCANNYLGLADHPDIVAAAHQALDRYGYGMASVRFICGTQTVHKELESRLSSFLGTDDTILYSSCFDANGGLFETILDEQDAVISDSLNHASIIDGIRLCRARRLRYDNNDMDQLEARLVESADARYRLIATDGVFSMDGVLANLSAICDLAERHDALVMVDDSHAVGLVGRHGKGTHEFADVMGRVDIITGTLGKALGGASGGYTSGRREVIDWLRQRSRPYLFSNSLAPVIASATITVLDLLESSGELRVRVQQNAARFRAGMRARRVHAGRGRAPHHPGHARRRPCRFRDGRAPAGRGDLRDCVLVPGRATGQGAHPHTDVGSAHRRRHRPCDRGLRPSRPERWACCREGTRQSTPRARAVARRRPEADSRRSRCVDQGSQDIDLRHRPAHPPLGRLGAVDHSGADGRRSRVHGRDRGARRRCGGAGGRPTGRRRGARDVRSLPQLQRRPTRVLPQSHRRRRDPARGLRRIRRDPLGERVRRSAAHRRQRRRGARSVGKCHPHLASIRCRRRGRADHRGRPDRHPGDGDRAAHRRPQRRRDRCQPLSARHGRQAGRQLEWSTFAPNNSDP